MDLEHTPTDEMIAIREALQVLGASHGWRIIQQDLADQYGALQKRLMLSTSHDEMLRTQGALRLLHSLIEWYDTDADAALPLRRAMIATLSEEEDQRQEAAKERQEKSE